MQRHNFAKSLKKHIMRKFFSPLYIILYYIYHIGNPALKADTMFQIASSFTVRVHKWIIGGHAIIQRPHTLTRFLSLVAGFKTVHLKVSIGIALIIEKKCCFRFRKQIFRNDLCVCYSVKFFPCLPAWRANKRLITLPYWDIATCKPLSSLLYAKVPNSVQFKGVSTVVFFIRGCYKFICQKPRIKLPFVCKNQFHC